MLAGAETSGAGAGKAGGALPIAARSCSCARRSVDGDLGDEGRRFVFREHAVRDEPGGIHGADRRLLENPLDHQRLRVGRVVLLVVAEAAVADEIDDEVVAELRPVGEREPDGGERRLGVVRVDVDDRDVEALRQVARVAGGAAFGRVGGVPHLVVRDQVERAARRVPLERLQVERLGDDTLTGERGVSVDENRQCHRRVVNACAARAVRLLRPGTTLDHRVGGLEVARVRDDRHVDLAGWGHARAGRRKVVLHVARSALRVEQERIDRPLALELAQDRLVRAADGVHEGVQPAPVRHSDGDFVRSARRRQRDRLVEHRHERLEALERELLLAEERPAQVLLEAFRLGEAAEECAPLLGLQGLAEAARLDRLAQPDTLGVVGDVLDLVGDRPRVDLAQERQRVGQRLALDVETEHRGRNARLELRRQRGHEPRLIECRVSHRLGAQRIEARGQVAVHAVGLDERHGCRDAAEERLVDGYRRRAAGRRLDGLGSRAGLAGLRERRSGGARGRGRGGRARRWRGNQRRGRGLRGRRRGGDGGGRLRGRSGIARSGAPAGATRPAPAVIRRMRPDRASNSSRHSSGTLAGASRYASNICAT